jgi:hypothetical protein
MPDYPFGEGKSLPHKKAAAAAVTAGASGSSKMAFSKELKPLKPKKGTSKPPTKGKEDPFGEFGGVEGWLKDKGKPSGSGFRTMERRVPPGEERFQGR